MPRIPAHGACPTYAENSRVVNPSCVASSNEPGWDKFLDSPFFYRPVRPKSMDAGNPKSRLSGPEGIRRILGPLQNEEFPRPLTTSDHLNVEYIPFFGNVKEVKENDIVLTKNIVIVPEGASLPDEDRKKYSKQDTLFLPHSIMKSREVDPYTGFFIFSDLFQHAKRLLMSILALLPLIYHLCRQLLKLPFRRSVDQHHLSRLSTPSADEHENCLFALPESVPSSPTETDVEDEFNVENLLFGCYPTPETNQAAIPPFFPAHRLFMAESFLDGMTSGNNREGTDRSTLVSTLTDLSSRLDDQGNIPLLHFSPRQGRCLAHHDSQIQLQRATPKESVMNRVPPLPRREDPINVDSACKSSPFLFGGCSDITHNSPSSPDEDEFFMPTGSGAGGF